MFNFLIAMKEMFGSITLIDLVKAFGDNSILYYNSDPELIQSIIKAIQNL